MATTVKTSYHWGCLDCLACHVIPEAAPGDREHIRGTVKEHVDGFGHRVEVTTRENGEITMSGVVTPK